MPRRQVPRTGMPHMDADHERLAELAERFSGHVAADERSLACRTIEALSAAIEDHHERERALMVRLDQAQIALDQHLHEHRIMEEMIRRCRMIVHEGRSLPILAATETVLIGIPFVLTHHIQQFDCPLAQQVRRKQEEAGPLPEWLAAGPSAALGRLQTV